MPKDAPALWAIALAALMVQAYRGPRPIGPLRPWDCRLPSGLRVTLYATDPRQLECDHGATVLGV